jgi:hypothetical protein
MNATTSRRRTRAEKICWLVAAAGAAMLVGPFLAGDGLGEYRYPMVLLGALVLPSALLVIPLFRGRARVAAALAEEAELLAHWRLSEAEWAMFVSEDAAVERQAKWRLFRVVAALAIGIGGVFVAFDPGGGGPAVLAAMVGLCGLIAVAIVWGTRVQTRRRNAGPAEVRIAADGLRLGQELHVWRGFGARLESVDFDAEARRLVFSYSTRAKNQRQLNVVRVPVPVDATGLALDIAKYFEPRGGVRDVRD